MLLFVSGQMSHLFRNILKVLGCVFLYGELMYISVFLYWTYLIDEIVILKKVLNLFEFKTRNTKFLFTLIVAVLMYLTYGKIMYMSN